MACSGGDGKVHYSYAQLEQFWINAGGPANEAAVAAAVALAESGGDPTSWNRCGNSAGTDQGLWQINDFYNPYFAKSGNAYDPAQNAQAAVYYWKQRGWKDWVTYTTGAYLKYLKSGVAPSAAGIPAGFTIPGVPNIPNPLSPSSWISGIASAFGIPDLKDGAERLGLIILGATLLFIGIYLNGRQASHAVIGSIAGKEKEYAERRRVVRKLAPRKQARTKTSTDRALESAAEA